MLTRCAAIIPWKDVVHVLAVLAGSELMVKEAHTVHTHTALNCEATWAALGESVAFTPLEAGLARALAPFKSLFAV